jgi:diaminopimelate epimerase
VHGCQLYDAAGNKILWLDGGDPDGEAHFDELRSTGRRLVERFQFGQELTAILYSSPLRPRALFWNRDGTPESMCGNAMRCAAHFIANGSNRSDQFAIETPHGHYVSCKMDVHRGSVLMPLRTIRVSPKTENGDVIVDDGTPHRIRLVDREWPEDDVKEAVACSNGAKPINFDLVRQVGRFHFRARVFERGVGETASCGTGAAAIVASVGRMTPNSMNGSHPYLVQFASGEELTVRYDHCSESLEVGGRVKLLKAVTIPALDPL